MQLLILFVLCFFLDLYILIKLKQNRFLRRLLDNRGILLSLAILISCLVAIFRNNLFGYVVYATMFYLVFDLICFLLKHINGKVYHAFRNFTGDGIVIFVIALIVTAASSIHIHHIVTKEYEVRLEKEMAKEKCLMLITDMHLGTTAKESIFDTIIETIDRENPDYILFAGDIVDESTSDDLVYKACEKLSHIAKEHEVYYVLGNHEYVRGNVPALIDKLSQAGVQVLVDETMLIDDSFYLIGRMDKYNSIVSKQPRASLNELTLNVDFNYPVILVDHQPVEMEHAKAIGVDLVLSGHTHAGQFFPLSFFAYFVNERLYGCKVENGSSPFYTIVSSGIGGWGMAMRNDSDSEIVIVHLYGTQHGK